MPTQGGGALDQAEYGEGKSRALYTLAQGYSPCHPGSQGLRVYPAWVPGACQQSGSGKGTMLCSECAFPKNSMLTWDEFCNKINGVGRLKKLIKELGMLQCWS